MHQPTPTARTRLARFRTRQRTAGSAIALCALGALCALVVSACGSSSAASSSTSTTTSTSTTGATSTTTTGSGSFTAFQNCLKKHGVTFAGAGFGGPGRGATGAAGAPPPAGTTGTGRRPNITAAQQKAFSACSSLRPSGAAGGPGGFGGGAGGGANTAAFAKFQACLQKHGVQAGSIATKPSSSSQAAIAACRSLLPAGGFGPGSGSSSGGGAANSATFAKYQACLRQHGVQTGAAGQKAAKLQAAITACRHLLPSNGTTGTTTTTTNG